MNRNANRRRPAVVARHAAAPVAKRFDRHTIARAESTASDSARISLDLITRGSRLRARELTLVG